MLFNSFDFGLFLPIVFGLYWFVFQRNLKWQNVLMLVASYIFYGWWDWRFLIYMILSTAVAYFSGIFIGQTDNRRKQLFWLAVSLAYNLGALFYFKYANFFIENFVAAFRIFGQEIPLHSVSLLLPIGISFYTFQALSYSVDVYRKHLEPTRDWVSFASFVSFFPHLVAGPIMKATDLLPQFFKKREFNYEKAVDGSRQMLWGFFKKVLIADNIAPLVNPVFQNYDQFSGLVLAAAAVLFVVQIYCDFAGYSDIALGTARLFGFELITNFSMPYHAKSVTEFWRRWHISLGNWTNSYIFNPISKPNVERFGEWGMALSLFITFVVIGFWHGADWKFVVFGMIHGTATGVEFLTRKRRKKLSKKIGKQWYESLGWLVTMLIWVVACVIFRAKSLGDAVGFVGGFFSNFESKLPFVVPISLIVAMVVLFASERFHHRFAHGLAIDWVRLRPVRWAVYLFFAIWIWALGGAQADFIYFQF